MTLRRSLSGPVTVATAAAVVAALPLYLTAALVVQLSEDLVFGAARLGLTVAIFKATGVVVSKPMGNLTDRFGATASLRLAIVASGVACLGIGLATPNWYALVLWLVLAACGKTLCQPAGNRLLTRRVREGRQGTAFALKQSSAPLASLVSGLAIPALALTVGWRAPFILVAIAAAVILVSLGRPTVPTARAATAGPGAERVRDRHIILALAAAFGLASAASSTVPIFYVAAAVNAGTPVALAGPLLAVASLGAIGMRLGLGWVADRMTMRPLPICAGLLLAGSLGFLLLSLNRPVPMAAGALAAMLGVWGFNGLFWFALMRSYADMPGRATGIVAPVGLAGGVVSPIVFGLLSENVSFPAAWLFAGGAAIAAAAAMFYGATRLGASTPADAVHPG